MQFFTWTDERRIHSKFCSQFADFKIKTSWYEDTALLKDHYGPTSVLLLKPFSDNMRITPECKGLSLHFGHVMISFSLFVVWLYVQICPTSTFFKISPKKRNKQTHGKHRGGGPRHFKSPRTPQFSHGNAPVVKQQVFLVKRRQIALERNSVVVLAGVLSYLDRRSVCQFTRSWLGALLSPTSQRIEVRFLTSLKIKLLNALKCSHVVG